MPFTDDPLNGFIRSLDAGGMVAGVAASGLVTPQTLVSPRADRQLFLSHQASADSSQLLECQSNNLFLQAATGSGLMTAPEKGGETSQQWWLSADGHLSSEAMGANVLALRNGAYAVVPRDANDVTQKFEFVYPAAEFYIRNSRSGFFLTAGANNSVSWMAMSPAIDAAQRWYNTPSQRLMSRATGKVLQASGSAPGSALSLGDALAVGPGSTFQAFVESNGALWCLAAETLVVSGGVAPVNLVTASPSDPTQAIELISPFSFFLLQSNLPQPAGAPPVDLWLTFKGGAITMERARTDGRGQLFAVSRFGQIFNADQGCVFYFYFPFAPPMYLFPGLMDQITKEALPRVTFRFEGEILSTGGRGLIRFPANAQVCTVMMSGLDPKVALWDISNDPSQAVQYWNAVDPLNGAMRFFMERILDAFGNSDVFPG